MQFLMLIYRDRVHVDAPDGPVGGDVDAWVDQNQRGVRLAGEPIAPDSEAVTVRVRGGSTEVDKGAFLDTADALLGFDLLDCEDQNQAIAVAAEHPLAARHVCELRPLASD